MSASSSYKPVSCDEVARELGTPTGALSAADLAAHCQACPACAAEAARARRLDHVWSLTRPSEPSETAWRTLWDRVQNAPTPLPIRPVQVLPRRRSWTPVFAAASLAQAAALLAAFVLWPRHGDNRQSTPGPSTPLQVAATAPVEVEYELEAGQTLFLVLDNPQNTVVVKPRFVSTADLVAFDGETPDLYDSASQGDILALNYFEGLGE